MPDKIAPDLPTLDELNAETPATEYKPQPKKTATKKRSPRRTSLADPLAALIGVTGTGVGMFNKYDGEIILAAAPDLAAALDELAKEVPAVDRVLRSLLVGSAWSAVVSVVGMQIALPIAINHNAIGGAQSLFRGLVPAPDDDGLADNPGADVQPDLTAPANGL